MNWNQLYTTLTPEERYQLMLEMLKTLERRASKRVLVRGRLLRDRRRVPVAHFIGDRRILYKQRRRKTLITYGLAAAAVATWGGALFMQPITGALTLTAFNLALISILLIKPYLRWTPVQANG
jgi:hypothetical protein